MSLKRDYIDEMTLLLQQNSCDFQQTIKYIPFGFNDASFFLSLLKEL